MSWKFNPFTSNLDYYESGNIQGQGINFVIVPTVADAEVNGLNLLESYEAAKSLTPNGAALSANNRATVLLPPAVYDLDTTSLTLDAQYVDIVGLTVNTKNALITCEVLANSGTIVQTANDVIIESVSVTNSSSSLNTFAYYPSSNLSSTVIKYCSFSSDSGYTMRTGIEYSGRYDYVESGDYSFGGGVGGTASGLFINCFASAYSFGSSLCNGRFYYCSTISNSFGNEANSIVSGTFVRCSGGSNCFGYGEGSTISGYFDNCGSGDNSFGYKNSTISGSFSLCNSSSGFGSSDGCVVSGVFNNCIAGGVCFGGGDNCTVSGYFDNCSTIGSYSFGAGNDCTISGVFINCTASEYSFGGGDNSIITGSFSNCTSGNYSFGYGNGSQVGGQMTNCILGGDYSVGGNVGATISANISNCTIKGNNSLLGTLTGNLTFVKLLQGTFPTVSGSGVTRYCVDGLNMTNNQG